MNSATVLLKKAILRQVATYKHFCHYCSPLRTLKIVVLLEKHFISYKLKKKLHEQEKKVNMTLLCKVMQSHFALPTSCPELKLIYGNPQQGVASYTIINLLQYHVVIKILTAHLKYYFFRKLSILTQS